ncbi:hypothetical protein GMRT_10817 [Giardia muris]|uniref:Uncharacterized protein n=1 Tax=Giardia muris TaxID=5742 RepID=A0A4Z1SNW5_GIAMU|nr:hypothetical protein GMRT_10817 [Giardia muris]|eukprot:TNJ27514.1 hypothetical protein GMRT_10817 [Giardia muris]
MQKHEALYEVISSDQYSVTRRLTPDVVDAQLGEASRGITRRLRSLGILQTVNLVRPTDRELYTVADCLLKVIELAESNDVRVRQDFLNLRGRYEAILQVNEKLARENELLRREIGALKTKRDEEREALKGEVRALSRKAKSEAYKAQAAEKLRTVAEKQTEKLTSMLHNSRTLSVSKSYGVSMASSHVSRTPQAIRSHSQGRGHRTAMNTWTRPLSTGREPGHQNRSLYESLNPSSASLRPGLESSFVTGSGVGDEPWYVTPYQNQPGIDRTFDVCSVLDRPTGLSASALDNSSVPPPSIKPPKPHQPRSSISSEQEGVTGPSFPGRIMSVDDLVERYGRSSGTAPAVTRRDTLEKMQTQIAEAVQILNRAGIIVDPKQGRK